MKFSVLISVYYKENPEYFKIALESCFHKQTLKPNEVIIVKDGPLTDELNNIIKNFSTEAPVKIVNLDKNMGLGIALAKGIEASSNEIIARMDGDDISLHDRFLKQLKFFKKHPETTILGGQIAEFIDEPARIVGIRNVPTESKEINNYLKYRCPFNHMTVMFKRSHVLSVGNYQHWHFNEDYYLWVRMALASYKFSNLPDKLVNVRVGEDMYKRRGGWEYFKSEARLQRYMWENKVISAPLLIYNILGRFVIQVLMPNNIRGYIFKKLFRK